MRPTAVIAVLLAATVAAADPPAPALGVVTADTVTLRAAPRADAPDTDSLPRGTPVIVHHAEGDGWLAVQPPNGSIAWINHRFLGGVDKTKRFPQNGTVASDGEVKLAAGKVGVDRPLGVRRTRVPDGTVVRVLGPPVDADDEGAASKWYPIAAVADDFRYVPRDAVRLDGPAAAGFAVRSPAPTPPEWSPPRSGVTAPPAKAATPNHPLWVQAEQAEQAGRLDRAEELYFQLAKESNAPGGSPELANLCYTRIHALRERRRQPAAKTVAAPAGGVTWTAAAADPPARRDDPPREERRTAAAPAADPGRAGWTGAGLLRPAFRSGGRQYYALEDARGRVIVYALPAAGVDLARYRGKTVDLFGTVRRPDAGTDAGLVTVERVDAIR